MHSKAYLNMSNPVLKKTCKWTEQSTYQTTKTIKKHNSW